MTKEKYAKTKRTIPSQRPDDAGPIRLNKYLAQCGLGSRRKCDELIASGTVRINGTPVTVLGTRIDPNKDSVEVGKNRIRRINTLRYFAFCKPKDAIVTAKDPQGRTTIYDYLSQKGMDVDGLRYVGRLDRNSEGLLILTNDGDLIHALTHPRFQIKKVYMVRTDRPLGPNDVFRMVEEGIESEGTVLRAGAIRELVPDGPTKKREHWYEIDLFEGKNRQIRRMLESLGLKVVRLKRTQFGSVRLGGMQRGQVRPLTDREISGLRNTGHKKPRRKPS